MFVERAVFPGVGFVQIGDQRKILLNYNWQSSPFLPLSPRSCEDGFPSANAWEFKAAAQIDKFLFSCTEKTPKTARAVNTSSYETFSYNTDNSKYCLIKLYNGDNILLENHNKMFKMN